ncbi:MAG: coproporphyrinogen III oxidase, partial [Burkholderiales bacterium]
MSDSSLSTDTVDTAAVRTYLQGLQGRIVCGLETLDGTP